MQDGKIRITAFSVGAVFRRAVLSWLAAVTLAFAMLPADARQLGGLTMLDHISPLFIGGVLVAVFILLSALPQFLKRDFAQAERAATAAVFAVLAVLSVLASPTLPFAILCALVAAAFAVYAVLGHDASPAPVVTDKPESGKSRKHERIYLVITVVITVAFIIFDSLWTVCRVKSFSTPTFDFGIFSQMFYHMKTTGLMNTTVERDGLLSHMSVHTSPIYYVLLPFYMIAPVPETLEVLQVLVVASAVIPLFLLCRLHGVNGPERCAICAAFLLYPALAGGTSYDIHENCFLAPMLLWLLYAIDKKSVPLISVSLILTLMIKEDAAVYAAVIALFVLVSALLQRDRRGIITGSVIFAVSVLSFLLASYYLTVHGDGTLTNDRYPNFLVGEASPLVTIIKTAILCPMKLAFECVDAKKLTFIAQTLLPTLALPFITRRWERFILLIPYLLVNLISDYQYMHDVFFQYVFGSAACLFYLLVVNLADIKTETIRVSAAFSAAVVSAALFSSVVFPRASSYISRTFEYKDYYDGVRAVLDTVPDDASVTATTFYSTYLSQREILHDVRYSSDENIFKTEYVVVNPTETRNFTRYGASGYLLFERRLLSQGYEKVNAYGDSLVIFKKAETGIAE